MKNQSLFKKLIVLGTIFIMGSACFASQTEWDEESRENFKYLGQDPHSVIANKDFGLLKALRITNTYFSPLMDQVVTNPANRYFLHVPSNEFNLYVESSLKNAPRLRMTRLNLDPADLPIPPLFYNFTDDQAKHLTYLDISDNYCSTGIAGLSILINLEELYASINGLTSNEIQYMTNFPHLKKISLVGNPVGSGVAQIYASISGSLEEIDLSRTGQQGFLPDLGAHPELTTMRLNSNDLGNIESLSQYTNLTFLDLENNPISHQLFQISGLRNLTILNLENTGQYNMDNIRCFSKFTSLTDLNLARNHIIGNEDWPMLTSVQRLDLRMNPITGFDIINQCPNIISLNLTDTGLNNERLDQVSQFTGLTHLDISFNRGIDNDGILPLANLTNVTFLNFDWTLLDPEAISALFPNLQLDGHPGGWRLSR